MTVKKASAQPKRRPGFDVEAYLESAGPARRVVKYRRGAVVFSQGDPGDDVRYIQKGAIKLSVLSRIGKEAVVAMLAPGDFFGEGALAGQSVRIGTATAVGAEQRADHREGRDGRAAPRRAHVLGSLHLLHADPEHPHRGGPGRSALQLQRKAARPDAAAAGALRPGQSRSARCRRSRRRRSRK